MIRPLYYLALFATPLAAAIVCALLIVVLRPLLVRYAMARPNARSSHKVPTPQGGGIAVIGATLVAVVLSSEFANIRLDAGILTVFAATIFLACVGAVDDLKPIPVVPRLLLQTLAVGIVLGSLPKDYHLFGFLPFWGERVLLLIAGLWFVNLVNFMDGLDWMTVAEMVPVTAALTLFGLSGSLHGNTAITAFALCGALIGFAPFNRPVAKLFLGDVGSLPIGLLTGWCLLQLAGNGNLPAAILLPLYYLSDATITLFRRIGNGEEIWTAHRTHFYQRATDNGFSVLRVVGEVFALNITLATLAAITVYTDSTQTDLIALAIGAIMVALVLMRFSRPRAKA